MIVLAFFAFLAGIVTILSPCILPILPIILSGSVGEGKQKPIGIVIGFVGSFTFFTLFLTQLVQRTGISADALRLFSVVVIAVFGIALLLPQAQKISEKLFSKLSSIIPSSNNKTGFGGGLIIGLSLGLIWTPCVGPIIASVITLAATSSVGAGAAIITLSYSIGTAIPMFAIISGGRSLLQKFSFLSQNTGKIQKLFGIIMIVTAIGIYFNFDRQFQSYILDTFPQYGTGLTKLEENDLVDKQIQNLFQDDQKPEAQKQNKSNFNKAPEIIPGGDWINSEPLTIKGQTGKVVLVDFWTYTCINCIRTLPYLKDWHDKYSDKGLVIIGVHTPEFEFEKNKSNLQEAVNDFELTYPIVQDNNYATWRAYNNRYWPAKYLIDKDGYIRYTHFGEGEYDTTEKKIQELLQEAGQETKEISINDKTYQISSKTPELYLGYSRIEKLVSNESIAPDAQKEYSYTGFLPPNSFAYVGTFTITPEYTNPTSGAKLILNFDSKEVFLVMRSKNSNQGIVKVKLDQKNISDDDSGDDVSKSQITVQEDRLYKVVELDSPSMRRLELEFLDNNIEVFAFTFG